MLTMIYLFENTSSDREQGINYWSIEESYHCCLAQLSGSLVAKREQRAVKLLTPCRVKRAYRTSHHCATRAIPQFAI